MVCGAPCVRFFSVFGWWWIFYWQSICKRFSLNSYGSLNAMHCSWFVRNFFGEENAPNVRRDMETHPEFMESFRFSFWTVSQIARNPPFGPKLHEHFDRKYGWVLNKWDVCACEWECGCRRECECMCIAHLYFILLYTQTIRNTDLRLFVIPCSQQQWMDACKMTSVVQAQNIHRAHADSRVYASLKNQSRQLQNLYASMDKRDRMRAHIWDKNGNLQRVWDLVMRRIRNKAIAMHWSW